jgi:hypothetical protein
MAKAMGIANESQPKAKSSSLARLRINHSPVMGQIEMNGKKITAEAVKGGTYKLEIPDGATYYSSSVNIRPYLQRLMYKRFVKGTGDKPNRYVKTIMHDTLDVDLKDNEGGFNCGKTAGYVQQFKELPEKTQELYKQIKRVRVVLGTVELLNPTNDKGEEVELENTPFIWEIDNRDAFKIVGNSFNQLAKMQRLPVMHNITANTEERKLPNGNSFYLPVVSLDVTKTLKVSDNEQTMFADFLAWIDNYNGYIANAWQEKANSHMEDDDIEIVDNLVEIDDEEVA